ncbi:hypothetical protein AB0D54_24075 [Streptomyces xanthophaeus]|uniref:hypothetical protein n=1 Tax=Streptomyces xanthophaeus TaxID=67385 RepID=UPI0034265455
MHTPDLAALEALLIAEGASVRRESDKVGRFTDLLSAEWIKMRSLRSTYWVLALGASSPSRSTSTPSTPT